MSVHCHPELAKDLSTPKQFAVKSIHCKSFFSDKVLRKLRMTDEREQ
jgi:hypothetical protein